MPAAGKSTVAELLADRLRIPLIAKDELKERLYDTLGASDVDSSARLGAAAYALLFAIVARILASGSAAIAEANFFRGMEKEFAALPPHRLTQVNCSAPLDVLIRRYGERDRHPGHPDATKIAELPARYASGSHRPLDLPGAVIELETSGPLDAEALLASFQAR